MIKFIKDLGMHYAKPESKRKARRCLVECSGCGNRYSMLTGQFKAGYTTYCVECSIRKKRGEQLN